jgi:hypothetical protein
MYSAGCAVIANLIAAVRLPSSEVLAVDDSLEVERLLFLLLDGCAALHRSGSEVGDDLVELGFKAGKSGVFFFLFSHFFLLFLFAVFHFFVVVGDEGFERGQTRHDLFHGIFVVAVFHFGFFGCVFHLVGNFVNCLKGKQAGWIGCRGLHQVGRIELRAACKALAVDFAHRAAECNRDAECVGELLGDLEHIGSAVGVFEKVEIRDELVADDAKIVAESNDILDPRTVVEIDFDAACVAFGAGFDLLQCSRVHEKPVALGFAYADD